MVDIKPTVGRVVLYKMKAQAGTIGKEDIFPALVTRVHNDTVINLAVMTDYEIKFQTSVAQGDGVGLWDWMPFQKDQQARLAIEDNKK